MATQGKTELENFVTRAKFSWKIPRLKETTHGSNRFDFCPKIFDGFGKSWTISVQPTGDDKEEFLSVSLQPGNAEGSNRFVICTCSLYATDSTTGESKTLLSCTFTEWLSRWYGCTRTVFPKLVIQQTPGLKDFDDGILEVSVRISLREEDLCHFEDDDQALADRLDLLRSGVSPDLIFVLKDRCFAVHRQVLIPQSEVFKRMFENKMSESETGKIVIKDATAEIFDIFLKYLYTGSYPEEFEAHAVQLFILADKYEIKSLKQLCTVHFENMNLDHTSAKTLLYLACKYPCLEKLRERFVRYLKNHRNFLESQDWKEIEEEDPRAAIDILKLYARHF